MNKSIVLSIAIFLLHTTTTAQVKKTTPTKINNSVNQHLKVFDLTIASGDANTAIQALNYYISEQGTSNIYMLILWPCCTCNKALLPNVIIGLF